MSESDDTDILLIIPPDFYTVASSQTSSSPTGDNPVVSEILEHVQLLEERITAIESRDTSLDPSMFDGTESRQCGSHSNADFSTEKHSFINQFPCQRKHTGNYTLPNSIVDKTLPTNVSSNQESDRDDLLINGLSPFRTTMTCSGDYHRHSPTTRLSKNKFGISKYNDELISMTGFSGTSRSYRDIEQEKMVFNGGEIQLSPKKTLSENKCRGDNFEHILTSKDLDLFDERNKMWDDRLSSTPKKTNTSFTSFLHENKRTVDDRNSVKPINGKDNSMNDGVISGGIDAKQINENGKIKSTETATELPMNKEFQEWKSQKLISLSDFWLPNTNKSEEEMLKIKLEEEKFRREHCEQMIQELQKRLLEQQEKVAVALRVDKEKSDIIMQFQTIWHKFKARWNVLEAEHNKLQTTVEDLRSTHQSEITELQYQLKSKTEELEKINNLLTDSNVKYDIIMKEKISLLEIHANELENYKLLVQTAENRYENLKNDYDKLTETKNQIEQSNKNIQQELYKERLKSTEVRSEMSVIHKALDTCEAELTVLRQEKENLMLKLKEEENRNAILEKKKIMLIDEIDNAHKSEILIKEEMKSVYTQQEIKRSELRKVYQKQVDEAVNTKLKEFQAQLDAAESNFQAELDTKQRAIAECAARKIKSIIDKHQLEVNLLEEKHKEEKRLYDIRLSQTAKKAMALETQLNAQQDAKSRLAGQLHSLMEKQYHQALRIISTGNIEHYDQSHCVNNERSCDNGFDKNSHDCMRIPYLEPVKLEVPKSERNQMNFQEHNHDYDESLMTFRSSDESPATKLVDSKEDLKKYIQMILQMQQPKKHYHNGNNAENQTHTPPICREVPRKYYMKADTQSSNDEAFPEHRNDDKNSADFLAWNKNTCSVGSLRVSDQMEMKHKPPWK